MPIGQYDALSNCHWSGLFFLIKNKLSFEFWAKPGELQVSCSMDYCVCMLYCDVLYRYAAVRSCVALFCICFTSLRKNTLRCHRVVGVYAHSARVESVSFFYIQLYAYDNFCENSIIVISVTVLAGNNRTSYLLKYR